MNKNTTTGLLLGYARVSTDDQDLTNQRAELQAAGCTKLFSLELSNQVQRFFEVNFIRCFPT